MPDDHILHSAEKPLTQEQYAEAYMKASLRIPEVLEDIAAEFALLNSLLLKAGKKFLILSDIDIQELTGGEDAGQP